MPVTVGYVGLIGLHLTVPAAQILISVYIRYTEAIPDVVDVTILTVLTGGAVNCLGLCPWCPLEPSVNTSYGMIQIRANNS
jgi:hypothetical protein